MNWNTVASIAFGAVTPILIPAAVVAAFMLVGGWFSIPDKFHLDYSDIWTAGIVMVCVIVAAIALAIRFTP